MEKLYKIYVFNPNMKNKSLYIIIFIVLVLLVFFLVFENSNTKENLTNQEIKNIINPEIDNYCTTLNNTAYLPSNQGHYCPTCNNISESLYTISNSSSGYNVSVKINLIYHWRNDMPGYNVLNYNLDNQGNILNTSIPNMGCK